ncbi:RidA family protein [Enterococcus aquimarinus]|uniref:TdcF protein n=1 Tax=Enterococcus aquimarinus TaxID=328396 RepID=A0A1L8QXV1_9ENTE|nr:RidA family protein [Enterococcus aquimarinus]MBP6359495.1 RidA family protein [Enterococcus sp.]MBP7085308.1 RidA family protein [Enterococcus sp.]MBP7952714.1 RidA family protein [Enterococcus sp.]MBP9521132.1 RidA family protein [Enterococcus sp.]MBP9638896.1 RidA family protein [Enterococcus sp.]
MTVIQTNQAPKAIGPYVQGRIANGFLFASGQVPLDAVTGEVVGSTIEEQTTQVLKNISAILTEARITPNDIVKTTCFLKNMDDFVAFNQVYGTLFHDVLPARSAVEVARLPKDVLIEIEIIADVSKK